MNIVPCKEPDCQRPAKTVGLCAVHYQRRRKAGFTDPCVVGGCAATLEHPTTGRCHRHHEELRLSQITATCSIEGCDNPIVNIARRLCSPHYDKCMDDQQTAVCVNDGCDNIIKAGALGMCSPCYQRFSTLRRNQLCAFYECDSLVQSGDLCPGHTAQRKEGRHLAPLRPVSPRGMGNIDKGYVLMVRNGVKKGEHRWVMEDILGRELLPGENVHHKNGIRHDNRPENLELWTKPQPTGARICDLLEWADWLIATYRN